MGLGFDPNPPVPAGAGTRLHRPRAANVEKGKPTSIARTPAAAMAGRRTQSGRPGRRRRPCPPWQRGQGREQVRRLRFDDVDVTERRRHRLRTDRVARHQRQRQQQLVLDEIAQVQRLRQHQHFVVHLVVERRGRRLVLDEAEMAIDAHLPRPSGSRQRWHCSTTLASASSASQIWSSPPTGRSEPTARQCTRRDRSAADQAATPPRRQRRRPAGIHCRPGAAARRSPSRPRVPARRRQTTRPAGAGDRWKVKSMARF